MLMNTNLGFRATQLSPASQDGEEHRNFYPIGESIDNFFFQTQFVHISFCVQEIIKTITWCANTRLERRLREDLVIISDTQFIYWLNVFMSFVRGTIQDRNLHVGAVCSSLLFSLIRNFLLGFIGKRGRAWLDHV
jgi:hypothetical protein